MPLECSGRRIPIPRAIDHGLCELQHGNATLDDDVHEPLLSRISWLVISACAFRDTTALEDWTLDADLIPRATRGKGFGEGLGHGCKKKLSASSSACGCRLPRFRLDALDGKKDAHLP